MEIKEIQQLITHYLAGTATEQEIKIVEQWYENIRGIDPDLSVSKAAALKEELSSNLSAYIDEDEKEQRKSYKSAFYRLYRPWVTAAAALFFCFVGVAFYFYNQEGAQQPKTTDQLAQDIPPGGNKAYLTLEDGSVVILDGAKNGKLASQGNTAINKTADGRLTYDASVTGKPLSDKISYNTIVTPRGGQYIVVLPDGSKIWLNSASSLKFPTAFNGKERNVEMTGEAYFEIAKNASMPFRVKSEGQTIEVLGTHFNINAYKDEPATKSTLIEGSVKVKNTDQYALLKPGQQSALPNNGSGRIVVSSDVDLKEVMAWKEGLFQFNGADIKTIMRQISRWYDVDVEFEGKVSSDHFKGQVLRDSKVSKVLRILELSGVKFKIEGKKIIVK